MEVDRISTHIRPNTFIQKNQAPTPFTKFHSKGVKGADHTLRVFLWKYIYSKTEGPSRHIDTHSDNLTSRIASRDQWPDMDMDTDHACSGVRPTWVQFSACCHRKGNNSYELHTAVNGHTWEEIERNVAKDDLPSMCMYVSGGAYASLVWVHADISWQVVLG
jgi:hypothetical protein